MKTAEQYVESLRARRLILWVDGEKVASPVDHPKVRPAIAAIAESLPDLARHLEVSVRTGVFCSYTPDPHARIRWRVTS